MSKCRLICPFHTYVFVLRAADGLILRSGARHTVWTRQLRLRTSELTFGDVRLGPDYWKSEIVCDTAESLTENDSKGTSKAESAEEKTSDVPDSSDRVSARDMGSGGFSIGAFVLGNNVGPVSLMLPGC